MTVANNEITEPLRTILQNYFNVELFWNHFPKDLKDYLALNPTQAERFKAQFADAIAKGTLTTTQYHQLTGQVFNNVGELYAWLTKLWSEIYGDEPIPGDQ